jgi:cellulose synthase/poly-beta-1,6-N-acetylglucosamine synthase-like glycosyltransferase
MTRAPEAFRGFKSDGSSAAEAKSACGAAIHMDDDERLKQSISGLRDAAPQLSAHTVLSRGQWVALAVLGGLLATGLFLDAVLSLQVLLGFVSFGYALALIYRLVLVRRGMVGEHLVRVSDADARAVPDEALPMYTVLVPAYREPDVIAKVLSAVSALEYPRERLDVRLLLEADDKETIAVARAAVANSSDAGEYLSSPGALTSVSIVLVPRAEPRTKPKACNFGLHTALGEFVTIFDAEDRPEPLQLRRAVVAMGRLGPRYACVQAQLGYFNATQNRITRWFTVEYGNWFRFLLPGLVSVGAPVPLGGTSNHFRAAILRGVGAWDAFNVTEDADLGIRLARLGYSVGVLDSVTQEEANSDFINWVKQRSRWYKGYLQTWLVHMRHPFVVHRELGWRGALGLHLFVAGTPLTTLINPAFWALSILWFTEKPSWIVELFPTSIYYVALGCFVLGNAAVVYMNVLTTRVLDQPELLGSAFTVPVYWVMMSAAAAKAVFQLAWQPSYWEKTTHGLPGSASLPLKPLPGDAAVAGELTA